MEQVKNILILSTSNPYKTAGIVAYDIYKGFKEHNYNVKLLVENYDNYAENDIISIQTKSEFQIKRIISKVRNSILKVKNKILPVDLSDDTYAHYHFDNKTNRYKEYTTEKILDRAGILPDVIIVIFAQYFISFKNLVELQKITKAPILWQFADMHPFTGGCHYAWDCKGYMSLCENCPAFKQENKGGVTYSEMQSRLEHMKNVNITPIIGSDWLIHRAQKSTLFKNSTIEKIYLSLDANFMCPYPQDKISILRENYNLDNNKYVILLMAKYLSHKRKGIDIIVNALQLIEPEFIVKHKLHLLIVGKDFDHIKDRIQNKFSYTHIDSIDRDELPDIYNVSDLFISASLQEVGPYTLTESLLCETPVIALDHGYANEFVINKHTGFLVEDDSPVSLMNAIIEMLNIEENDLYLMKKNCRERTKDLVSKNNQIRKYIELINTL